ncbi:AAA family ATPase [Candidatus Bathycorpusculum sp.]|uniref:AAA family ATPase n=1 Tax=Candidatus Bathycorpusculum sp. TaxID=2994959 RepID=UPI00281FB448|nr:flagellar hook-basal body complex protein FliE [Candidatus Termitimicrobium sp.]MCL2432387.1 flagellar hook-basal body complex protein FliE [Candidatus Termitimicrobium sp.]
MTTDKLVIGLGGMPGSGKSIVVETAREMGYAIITMGDVVREQTHLRGLTPTPQNIGAVMLALRAESGNYVIAQKCIPKIKEQTSNRVLIDGLRSIPEVDIFKEQFARFTLVSVHAPPQTRFERLKRRGRSDDPTNYTVFAERDNRELGVGVGNVIAISEQIIVNNSSIEAFKTLVREDFNRIETAWLTK